MARPGPGPIQFGVCGPCEEAEEARRARILPVVERRRVTHGWAFMKLSPAETDAIILFQKTGRVADLPVGQWQRLANNYLDRLGR